MHAHALRIGHITDRNHEWHEEFTCPLKERFGSWGDGGKWVCAWHHIANKIENGQGCLVYSIGSNSETSFENSVLSKLPGCEVHTFDHTVSEGFRPTPGITFHRTGLAAADDDARNLSTLPTIRRRLGHAHREIDILKIDIEGNEYDFLRNVRLALLLACDF